MLPPRRLTRKTCRRFKPFSALRASQYPHLLGAADAPRMASDRGSKSARRSLAGALLSVTGNSNPLVGQVAGQLGEVVDVALHVFLGVLHGKRPVLFRERSHEHATVGLVQPRGVRPRLA